MKLFGMALRALLVVVALLVAAALAGYLYLRYSLPQTQGQIALIGLSGPVEVLRDGHGVPHIYARSIEDAYYGLGFVHAQDRLWQMEMNRRTAAGRVAEILGPRALDSDRFLRTLGVRRAAEESFKRLDTSAQRSLEAYARGVNAFLGTEPVLPPEFWLLDTRPERWAPADSLAWVKMMAWDLGGNWRSELLRMRLASRLPPARIEEFLAPYPGERAHSLPDLKTLYAEAPGGAARLLAMAPPAAGSASNNWAVTGERSASGKALLANDPHLGLTTPSIWYLAHLSAPGLNVIGATLPGVPGVVLGRNERISWAFTNTGSDVQDLYLEKTAGAGEYLTPEGPRPFGVRQETLKVRGAPDVAMQVRSSRHGPIISDALSEAARGRGSPAGQVLAFRWTALLEDDRTAQAVFDMARAHNWREFTQAARHFNAPQQNMLYADVEGNIGFIAAGRVPVRKPENELRGLAPAPGWSARYDWAGFVPFEQLPRSFNPRQATLHTANEKVVPPNYRHLLTTEWDPPYRARRIAELLAADRRHDAASFMRMQADDVSLALRDLMPKLLQATPRSEQAKQALALLRSWDARMSADRPEPLIAAAWWREFTRALYEDELGELFAANWELRPVFVDNVLSDRNGQSRWCDDVRTPAAETCAELLAASLEKALDGLRRRYGTSMREWRWGTAHAAKLEHRPFERNPWLAPFFSIEVPTSGGAFTLNRGRYRIRDEAAPFASRHGSSLRAIYDMADPGKSVFIHSGGQSGNVLSAHYAAFTGRWAKGEYIPMLTERAKIEAAGAERLVLVPK